MTHIMRIDEQIGHSFLNDYSIMVWTDMNAIENELSDVIKRDKKRLIELEFVRDGVAGNLQEFLEVCKEISETLGVDIYFDIPNNNDTCNCSIYINDVHVGVCIISNNKDTKSKLNTILNTGDMGNVKVK